MREVQRAWRQGQAVRSTGPGRSPKQKEQIKAVVTEATSSNERAERIKEERIKMDTGSGTRSLRENTVLSLSIVSGLLAHREAALRSVGYRVFSLTTESQARFEIEMGRCGILLLCYTIHQAIHRDLAELFGQRCEAGVIAFVMDPKRQEESPYAHICLLDSDFPHNLHRIEGTRTKLRKSA